MKASGGKSGKDKKAATKTSVLAARQLPGGKPTP